MITSTWKLVVLGCAMIIVLVAANATVTSHAREHTVTQQSFRSELPAAFNTNPIVGSDASIDTYGLETGQHLTDF